MVGLILKPLTLTASLLFDGKPILDGIPLVQGAWAGASPEVTVRTTWPAARIEDFEARYKDLVLRPKTAGDEVSQALSKDSFEAYATGTFPTLGGWRASGIQTTDPAASSSRVVIDETDSATGLRSLLIETDGKEETIVSKRLSLPARVPFGVSEGNFSIGAGEIVVQSQSISRSRLMDEQRREREGKDGGRAADRAREKAADASTPTSKTDRPAGSASGTAKMMSASPVGNFYIYSFDGKLLQVYDVYGHLLKDYIYMGDRLIAEYDYVGSRYLYYTPDQINTTRVVTDGVGNVVYSAVHDPYGGIQQTLVSTYDPQLKFSGKERDAESQLDYFGARYYDRSQYRFQSPDPIVTDASTKFNPSSWNLYSYCGNNPLNYVDKTGLYKAPVHYTLTYELALLAGFSKRDADIIASACVGVDSGSTSSTRIDKAATGENLWIHFPSPATLAAARLQAANAESLYQLGFSLHIIQDSYSHGGYKIPFDLLTPLGTITVDVEVNSRTHAMLTVYSTIGLCGDPDDPKSCLERYEKMKLETFYTLVFWRANRLRFTNDVIYQGPLK